jgi:hypothetical protein
MLHIAIIIRILLTFPRFPPTFCQSINRSHSATYDFYRCGYTNGGILISSSFNLSIFNSCMLFKSPHFSSVTYKLFLLSAFKHYHLLPLLLFLLRLAIVFPLFLHYCRSFFLSLFYTTIFKLFCKLLFLGSFFKCPCHSSQILMLAVYIP